MLEQDGGAVIERMSTGGGRLDPGDTDWKRLKERARDTHREDRGAKIMTISRLGDLCGGAGAADGRVAFDDNNGNSRRSKDDRSRKAIGTGADDGGGGHWAKR